MAQCHINNQLRTARGVASYSVFGALGSGQQQIMVMSLRYMQTD